ncbi:hypothetical protein OIE42_12485 [Streptomyces sp. NBC_00648]
MATNVPGKVAVRNSATGRGAEFMAVEWSDFLASVRPCPADAGGEPGPSLIPPGWGRAEVALPGATPADPWAGPAAPAPRSGLRRRRSSAGLVGNCATSHRQPADERVRGRSPRETTLAPPGGSR